MTRITGIVACIVIVIGAGRVARAAQTFGPVATTAEIAAAAAQAAPGDTIVMADGTWADANVVFTAHGAEGSSITLRAETPGGVVLSGHSRLHIAGEYLVVSGLMFMNGYLNAGEQIVEFRNGSSNLANHCRMSNCAIVDYNPPDETTNYKWVSVYGDHNRVDHCQFSGRHHIGVTLTVWPTVGGPPNYTRIDHNYFADRAQGTVNGYETIRIGTSDVSQQDSRATVEWNYFTHCDGEIEMISNKSCENVYRYNTFVDNKAQLTLRHGKRCRVEGNFFFGYNVSNASGVRIIDEGHVVVNNYFGGLKGTGGRAALVMANGIPSSALSGYFLVKDAVVAFNTFVDCEDNFAIGSAGSSEATLPPENCTIANNVVLGHSAPLIDYLTEPTGMTYEGNIMFGATLGIPQPAGITLADPKLVAAADGLYRPAADSPAIAAAAGDYPDVTRDMDGQPRDDGHKDVGADELSAAPMPVRPITASETGPTWLRGGEVWVDFAWEGEGWGSELEPFFMLVDAIDAVDAGGVVRIKGDTALAGTVERPRIDKAMRIEAVGGAVRIGVGAGG